MSQTLLHNHLCVINACNQRGRRMLSLVDLLDAGTVDLPLAAYLAAMMRRGASLLVGARPGGAGKTAVMCALLNFLPATMAIQTLDEASVFLKAAEDTAYGLTCYLAHEIGAGYYYAYIWGAEVRAFASLAARGHCVVSNLHTDTLQEVRQQLCGQNGVPEAHLSAITLKLFLRVERGVGGVKRYVSHVYENDGTQDHLLWTGDAAAGKFVRHAASAWVTLREEQPYLTLLSQWSLQNVRRIEDVRRALLADEE